MCDVNLRVSEQSISLPFNPVVLKFGGSSVKNIGRMHHVADIVRESAEKQKTIVVVSAMGDTTDHLHDLASSCAKQPDKRELDMLLSTGEQVSIALLTLILRTSGVNARSFTGYQIGLLTEPEFGNARIASVQLGRLQRALTEYDVIVVAGFQGATADGDITTLGRGGSDTTAVALAIAAGACECQIYTDVDGIFTADPNKDSSARLIDDISYEDCLQLVRAGAQVMHDRSVVLAQRYGLKVRVRNTFKPWHQGSLIHGIGVNRHFANENTRDIIDQHEKQNFRDSYRRFANTVTEPIAV